MHAVIGSPVFVATDLYRLYIEGQHFATRQVALLGDLSLSRVGLP